MGGPGQAFFRYNEPCSPHLLGISSQHHSQGLRGSLSKAQLAWHRQGQHTPVCATRSTKLLMTDTQAQEVAQGWPLQRSLQSWLEPGLLCFLGSGPLMLKLLSDSSTPVTLEVQKSLKSCHLEPEVELMHLGLPWVFLLREEAELPTSEQGPALLAVSCAAQVVLLA